MADIMLACSEGENLGGMADILKGRGEAFDLIDMEITDPRFPGKKLDECPSVVVSRFHEGDLASVKAMQAITLEHPCVQTVFITDKQLSSAILTLLFNQGAFGVLLEPFSDTHAWQLIKQAIKKSKWNLDDMARSKELKELNESLRRRIEKVETESARTNDLADSLERLTYFLLTEKYFKINKIKVLVISGNQYQRNLVIKELSGAGFTVESTDSSTGSIPIIKKYKPNIVVSDLEMEGMNGVELAQKVKGEQGFPPLHYVIITASEDKMDYILSPETKVDDCIIKPSDAKKHYAMVARIAMGLISGNV